MSGIEHDNIVVELSHTETLGYSSPSFISPIKITSNRKPRSSKKEVIDNLLLKNQRSTKGRIKYAEMTFDWKRQTARNIACRILVLCKPNHKMIRGKNKENLKLLIDSKLLMDNSLLQL